MDHNTTVFNKIQKFAKDNFAEISKDIILKMNNDYIIFAQYKITVVDNEFYVYNNDKFVLNFVNSQNALAWCILDHLDRADLANELIDLTHRLQHKEFDIEVARNLLKKVHDPERRAIIRIREENDITAATVLKKHMTKSVSMAKYFKQQGLYNASGRDNIRH